MARYWYSVSAQMVYEMDGNWEPQGGTWVEVTVIEYQANRKALER